MTPADTHAARFTSPAALVAAFSERGIRLSERALRTRDRELRAFHAFGKEGTLYLTNHTVERNENE
jgi:hypothetical protein